MMMRHRGYWMQALAIGIALFFGATEVMARGGGGGGGGGAKARSGGGGGAKARSGGGAKAASKSGGGGAHRGGAGSRKKVTRNSPAAGGMGSVKRAQSAPRSGGERKVASAKAGAEPRRGASQETKQNRQDNRAETKQNKQDNRTERTEIRQENRTERTEIRQDARTDRQENRQDFRDDRWEDRDWNEVDWDDWEVHDDFEWGLGTWMALTVGTAVTLSAWNAMTQQQGCNLQRVEVNDRLYMKCGNTWYIEALSGSDVHYVAVEAPIGY